MTQQIIPENDLETWMLKAQHGEMELEEFIGKLISSQVYLPLRDPYTIVDIQLSDQFRPFSLKDKNETEVLILFTSEERATEFLKNHEEVKSVLLEEFGNLLLKNGVGYGVSINPDQDIGMDLEPEMVEQLVQIQHARTIN